MTIIYNEAEYTAPLSLVENTEKSPRYYQANTVASVAKNLRDGIMRQDVISPTGTGKTFISRLIALSSEVRGILGIAENEKLRVLYMSHRNFLNQQAVQEYATSEMVELIPQMIGSKISESTLAAGWDICFIDECHHEAMISFQHQLEAINGKPIVGFTADNTRHDMMMLKFERSTYAISEAEACERGFIEKTGVNSIMDIDSANKTDLAVSIISEFHQEMGNVLVFMRTEKEVISTHRSLKQLGFTTSLITGDTSESELMERLDLLARGEIQFLINCKKIAEGMDAKAITDTFLVRKFESEQEKKQFIGRAIRNDSPCATWELVTPLKKCVLAKDIVGSTKYQRFIHHSGGKWHTLMVEGEESQILPMAELRHNYSAKYIATAPRSLISLRKEREKTQRELKRKKVAKKASAPKPAIFEDLKARLGLNDISNEYDLEDIDALDGLDDDLDSRIAV